MEMMLTLIHSEYENGMDFSFELCPMYVQRPKILFSYNVCKPKIYSWLLFSSRSPKSKELKVIKDSQPLFKARLRAAL